MLITIIFKPMLHQQEKLYTEQICCTVYLMTFHEKLRIVKNG